MLQSELLPQLNHPIPRAFSPKEDRTMFKLADLPYAYDALEPVISSRTLHVHHDKHHGGYIKTLNALLEGAGTAPTVLEDVIREASMSGDRKVFNSAAQAWNHSFFWASMTAEPQRPDRDMDAAIRFGFGDLAGLKLAFVKEGVEHFGSGWVWLVADRSGDLTVRSTHDADDTLGQAAQTPCWSATSGSTPTIWTTRTTGRPSWKTGSTPCQTGTSPANSWRRPRARWNPGGIRRA